MDLCFVLFEPRQPENVGTAARALTTMGFDDLRLVNSNLQHHHQARVLAHGARELLTHSRSFPDLASALADVDLVIGTTAKARHQRRQVWSPEQLRQQLDNKASSVKRCAILFGREDNGLSKRELDWCDALSTIPLQTSFPSLNLGQSVMLYAYALTARQDPKNMETAAPGEYLALKQRVQQLLEAVGLSPSSPPFRWASERLAALATEDIRFLHVISRQIQRQLAPENNAEDDQNKEGEEQ
jgi:tRNA/rRNA methyltransferase